MALELTKKARKEDYRGCGKVWAAVRGGKVVALRYAGDHRVVSGWCKEALDRARVTRFCAASRYAAERINDESFSAWREQARAELGSLRGVRIRFGMASGGVFVPRSGGL